MGLPAARDVKEQGS